MIWLRALFGVTCFFWIVLSLGANARTEIDGTKAYYVVLDSPPMLMHQQQIGDGAPIRSTRFKAKRSQARTYLQSLIVQQDSLSQRIQALDPNARVLSRFNRLVNALVVEIDPSLRSEILQLPGVSHVAPVRRVKPFMTKSNQLMNVPQAWDASRLGENAGDGVFVAIVDTGVDVTHPAFDPSGYTYPEGFPKGNAAFTSEKVIAARVFPPLNGSQGDTTPVDRVGHGTNVASIAAANSNVNSPLGVLSGVAPRAYVGNYKVFTNDESDDEQVVRAIESAVEDGADVINLSLGSDIIGESQFDIQVRAIGNAVNLGVVVVVAAGNDGDEEFTVGTPGQSDDAISVGSISNSHSSRGDPPQYDLLFSAYADGELIVDREQAYMGSVETPYTLGPLLEPIIGQFPLQDLDLLDGGGYGGYEDGLACSALPGGSVDGGWIFVQRGECTFVNKVNNMQDSGAQGVLFYDNKDENAPDYMPTTPSVEGTTIPSIMIDRSVGLAVKQAFEEGKEIAISIEGVPISDASYTPNRLSSYSAVGPTVNYAIKPDVVAIGEGSFAGAQNDYDDRSGNFNASGFQWLAGTSMSAPRVAGLAAILRHEHPDWPPVWIKSAMMLSADREIVTKANSSQPISVLDRGAGAVDAEATVLVDTVVVPSIVNFGAHMVSDASPVERVITVVNASEDDASYRLSFANDENPYGIVLSEDRFDLLAGGKQDIYITFPSIANVPDGDVEGDLIVSNAQTGLNYNIPYWIRVQYEQEPYGDVLLLDDDGESYSEQYYMDRLDEIGVQYTWWDANGQGYPSLDYLSRFRTVLWFLSGRSFNNMPNSSGSVSVQYRRAYNSQVVFEFELMKYLSAGGALFLSGQDYSDDRETAALMQEILSVSTRDVRGGASTVQGVSGHPFADGLGPFTLTFTDDLESWPDYLSPLDGDRVQRAFIADGNRSKTVGVTIDSCAYRAIYLAFPLEALDATAGATLLRKGLEWLNQKEGAGAPALSGMSPSRLDVSEESGPYSISINGNGFVLESGYRAYLDFVPLSDLQREGCDLLTGTAPAALQPGVYSLRVVTGAGSELRLDDALTVVDGAGTDVLDWALY